LEWHFKFDLHKVIYFLISNQKIPDIPLGDLPSKPLKYNKEIKSLKEIHD
jgi:hypothetical protein